MSARTIRKASKLQSLLGRAYELIEYCRSKFDTAPIPAYLSRYAGHVEDDSVFCDNRDKLLEDIRKLLTEEGDELRYSQFLSHMEHAPRSIDQSMSPVWKGMARCRCWWDARDHLQAVVDYLQDMLSSTTSRQSKRIWAVVIALIGVVIAAVTNLATSIVPNTLLPYLWLSWPLLVILVIISLALVYYSN